jgi:colicin import membrane protein
VKQTEAGKRSGLQPGRAAAEQPAARSPARASRRSEAHEWQMVSPDARGRRHIVRVPGDEDKDKKDVDAAKQVDGEAKAGEAADEANEEGPDEELAEMEALAAENERKAAELRAKAEKLKEEKAKKKDKAAREKAAEEKAAREKAAEKVDALERHGSPEAAVREGAATTTAVPVTASSGGRPCRLPSARRHRKR